MPPGRTPAPRPRPPRLGPRPSTAPGRPRRVPPAFASATLSGYPGQRGTVTVASMQRSAASPWPSARPTATRRSGGGPRAAPGRWSRPPPWARSPAGRAWPRWRTARRAGSPSAPPPTAGRREPLVLASADGVTWQPVPPWRALAGRGTEFLGIAAGHCGYVAVGRQMVGGRIFAVLWYSADLRSWTLGSNGGLDGRLSASTVNAVAATAGGFVAVGSHGAGQVIWISADGQHWSLDQCDPALRGGQRDAHARSRPAAPRWSRPVTRATPDGDIPVVVASADGGAQWRQIVLPAAGALGRGHRADRRPPVGSPRPAGAGKRRRRRTPSPGPQPTV